MIVHADCAYFLPATQKLVQTSDDFLSNWGLFKLKRFFLKYIKCNNFCKL